MYIGESTALTWGGDHLARVPLHVGDVDTPMYINYYTKHNL